MFRGKESSNRIEFSRLVQEVLNFGVFSSLWLWGVGVGVWEWGMGWVDGSGGWVVGWMRVRGAPHMCTCMCMHACTCMRGKHDNFMQMAAPMGKSLGIPYDVICMCACMCMHADACTHGWAYPPTIPHPHPTTLHPQGGDPWNQLKFNST